MKVKQNVWYYNYLLNDFLISITCQIFSPFFTICILSYKRCYPKTLVQNKNYYILVCWFFRLFCSIHLWDIYRLLLELSYVFWQRKWRSLKNILKYGYGRVLFAFHIKTKISYFSTAQFTIKLFFLCWELCPFCCERLFTCN